MPNLVKITIEPDTKAFFNWLDRVLDPAVNAAADEATQAVCNEITDLAKKLVPVDTGSLRRSIRKERGKGAGGGLYSEWRVRAGGYVRNPKTGRLVDYASYVEYGTSHMYPRPFMRPAVRRVMKGSTFLDVFSRGLERRVPR